MIEQKNIYLLLGPETGEKNEFIDSLKSALLKKHGGQIDEYNFYPYDTDISEVVANMQNISLFSNVKFVTIKNCEDLKKKDISILAEYIKEPASDTTLILLSDNTKVDAVIEKAVPADKKKIFWEMFESRKKSWVTQFFHKEKISIEVNAVNFLVDILEGDSQSLKKECSNLALFFGQSETITEDKITDFFYNRKEDNIFSLFDYIASANLEKSVESAKGIILSGESAPVQMLGGLLWQIKNIYELQKLLEKRDSFADACQQLGLRTKKMQSIYSDAVKNYSITDIENIISLTAYYDMLFRSVKTELQQTLFPVYLYSLIAKKGKNIFKTNSFIPVSDCP